MAWRRPSPPAGFRAESRGGDTLVCRETQLEEVRRAGLGESRRWESLLSEAPPGRGRGRTARLRLDGGTPIVLKRMRRGGCTAPLWRGRFLGAGRLLANLEVPIEAARRGIPTAGPVALLLRGRAGLFEGWVAFEEIEGAVDLATRLSEPPPPDPADLAEVLALVRRMHDAGVHHRDLNLGNLLVRARPPQRWQAFVVDLDRAVLRDRAVAFRARQSALRRMERSYRKLFGAPGPLGPDADEAWYRLYAGEDRALARRLQAGRAAGRLLLALHRLGWRG